MYLTASVVMPKSVMWTGPDKAMTCTVMGLVDSHPSNGVNADNVRLYTPSL